MCRRHAGDPGGRGHRGALNANASAFAPHGSGIAVDVDCAEGEPKIVGSHVLLAVGRRPNTDDLGLDKAGVQTDARGYIVVDDQFAPACRASGRWATATAAARSPTPPTTTSRSSRPTCSTATAQGQRPDPRLRALHRPAARPRRHDRGGGAQVRPARRCRRRPMTHVGRAVEKGETQGFMKIVVDAETERILGAAILGTGGDEAIHGFSTSCTPERRTRRYTRHAHPSDRQRVGADDA